MQVILADNTPAYLFWKSKLSQWHMTTMNVDGIVYNCCEQYMMAAKARLFGDEESAGKIMMSPSPREQQALGRLVKGFELGVWNEHALQIVYEGNWARYNQDRESRELLLGTKGLLVEASPHDCIWGVGLGKDDPLILDRKNWRGTNWLGLTLTRVRDELMAKV